VIPVMFTNHCTTKAVFHPCFSSISQAAIKRASPCKESILGFYRVLFNWKPEHGEPVALGRVREMLVSPFLTVITAILVFEASIFWLID